LYRDRLIYKGVKKLMPVMLANGDQTPYIMAFVREEIYMFPRPFCWFPDGIKIMAGIPSQLKPMHMIPRKDGVDHHLEERNRRVSSDFEKVNNEDNLDTRDISPDIEEGDEDYDDEELENDELTEADFDIDGEDDEDEELG
jgi:hypothetical protein